MKVQFGHTTTPEVVPVTSSYEPGRLTALLERLGLAAQEAETPKPRHSSRAAWSSPSPLLRGAEIRPHRKGTFEVAGRLFDPSYEKAQLQEIVSDVRWSQGHLAWDHLGLLQSRSTLASQDRQSETEVSTSRFALAEARQRLEHFDQRLMEMRRTLGLAGSQVSGSRTQLAWTVKAVESAQLALERAEALPGKTADKNRARRRFREAQAAQQSEILRRQAEEDSLKRLLAAERELMREYEQLSRAHSEARRDSLSAEERLENRQGRLRTSRLSQQLEQNFDRQQALGTAWDSLASGSTVLARLSA